MKYTQQVLKILLVSANYYERNLKFRTFDSDLFVSNFLAMIHQFFV